MAGQLGNAPPEAGGGATTAGVIAPTRPAATDAVIQTGNAPPVSTLFDDFSTQDTAKWGGWTPGFVDLVNGQVQITTTGTYYTLNTNALGVPYSLAGSAAMVEVVQVPNVGNGSTSAYLQFMVDPLNDVAILVEGGSLICRVYRAGVSDVTVPGAYDPVAHRWWRLAESAGTLTFATSPDAATWTVRRSLPTPMSLTAGHIRLMSGYYGTEPTPGVAIFDNFNLVPGTATLSGSGTLAAAKAPVAVGFTGAGTLDVAATVGISYVAAGAVASAGATSITPGMPAGVLANDILLTVLHSNDNAAVTPPTGWAVAGAVNAGTGSRTTVAWKRASGGDVAQAFTKTGTVAFIGQMAAFRGVRVAGNPYAVTPTTTAKTTASTAFSLTGLTTTSANNVIVACVGALIDASSTANFSGWTASGTGSMTEVIDNATLTLNGGAVGAAYGRRSTAAPTGNVTGTMTSAVNGGVVLALVPEPPPTAPTTVTATMQSASSIQVAWSGGTTTGVTWTVQYATAATGPWLTAASGLTASPYTHTGLNPGTTYWYRVLVVNPSVGSSASATVNATTTALPKVSTFTDDFATEDAAKWTGYGANAAVDTGRLRVTTAASYPGVATVNRYDLRDSILTVEVLQVPNLGSGSTSAYLQATIDANNAVAIFWEGGQLSASYTVGGVRSVAGSTAYNATAHRIWRIRESGGSLYWEVSSSGVAWTSLRPPIPTPLSLAGIQVALNSGYWGTETTPGSALFDNVNATYADPPADPRTIYVDPTGSDANDGLSSGAPWATVAKVTNTLLYPGDQVLFKRGATWTGNLVISGSGTSIAPITIGAYGTGELPTISGGGSSGVAGTIKPCEVYGSFIVLNDIEFRGSIDNDVFINGADCTIQGCAVRWGSYGIMQSSQAARLKVLYNTVADVNVGVVGPGPDDDTGGQSILLEGDSAEVAYNAISGAVFTSPDYGLDGSAIEVWGATNADVHHNRATDCIAFAELGSTASSANTFHHNVVTSSLAGTNGFVIHGDLYPSNADDPYGPVFGTKIYHNTVVLTSATAGSVGVWMSPGGEVDLRNNIVVVAPSASMAIIYDTTRIVTEGGNVFWGGAGNNNITLPGGVDPSSVIADPLFVSATDLRLLPGSPALDRGADLGYTTDFSGGPRILGTAPDSGAYEGATYPSVSTLTDGFTTQDNTKWTGWGANVVWNARGTVDITMSNTYSSLTSTGHYRLTGSSVYAKPFSTPPVVSDFSSEMYLAVYAGAADSNNWVGIAWNDSAGVGGEHFYCREVTAGVASDTQVAYNAATMVYWRIREAAGTLYWETSPDAVTWTAQRSKASATDWTNVQVRINAGYWGTVTGAGTASWDSINVAGPSAYSGTATLTGSGSLAVAGVPSAGGAVPLAGVGSLGVVGAPAVGGAATLAGSGTLALGATASVTRAVALTGAGALAGAAGSVAAAGTAALAASGSLSAAPSGVAVTRAVALTGAGGLTSAATVATGGATTLAGIGSLGLSGVPSAKPTVALAGSGTLTTAGPATPLTAARGVNNSDGAYNVKPDGVWGTFPGTYGSEWHYDAPASLAYLAGRGIKFTRLAFAWERLQPTRGAAFDSAEQARIVSYLDACQAAGLRVVIEPHDYARYREGAYPTPGITLRTLGVDLPVADIVDLWTRLATAFGSHPALYGWELMNEPYDLFGRVDSGAAFGATFDTTASGWTASNATMTRSSTTVRTGAGALQVTASGAGTANAQSAFTVGGHATIAFSAWVRSAGAARTAQFDVNWWNSAGAYLSSTSGGSATTSTTWQQVTWTATPPVGAVWGDFVVQVLSPGAGEVFYWDDVTGGANGALTQATLWEDAAQRCVTAIRAAGDTHRIYVPGYNWQNPATWRDNHPDPFVTDPAGKITYTAHFYFDDTDDGTYAATYAQENTNAIAQGYASVTDRTVSKINQFVAWCAQFGVAGAFTELGWPHNADATSWNATADAVYTRLDQVNMDAWVWTTGEMYGTTAPLNPYDTGGGSTLSSANAQASVIEAHLGTGPPVTAGVALAGAGSLAVPAVPSTAGAVPLTGAGSLTTGAVPAVARPVALTGAGTLAGIGVPATAGAVPLAGSGALAAVGAPTVPASVPLSGSGTLAVSGSAVLPGTPLFVKHIGTASNAAAGTTLTVTVPAGGIPVGGVALARVVIAFSASAPTIADSRGNTWTRDRTAPGTGSITRLAIFSCNVTTALLAGDTITITTPSVADRNAAIDHFSGITTPVDVTNGVSGTSTTPSAVGTPTTAQASELWYGVVSTNGPTTDTYTEDTGNGFTSLTRAGTTGTTVNGAYVVASAVGAPNYTPTLGTSRTWIDFVAAYRALGTIATGTVTLTGSGSLTVPTTIPATGGTVPLAGVGTLTVAATPAIPGTVPLAGAGALAAVAAPAAVGAVPLTGAGTLAAVAVPAVSVAVPLTGSGTLTTTAVVWVGYDAAVMRDTPVTYWRTYDGTRYVDAVAARHATGSGSPSTQTLTDGTAYPVFDGATQYAEAADADVFSVPTSGILTVEAWMRPDVLEFPHAEATGYVHWIGKGEGSGASGQQEWAGRMYSFTNTEVPPRPNRISGYAFNLAGNLGTGSYFEDTVTAGQWIHVAITINTVNKGGSFPNGYTRIFKNGVSRDQDDLNSTAVVVPQNGTSPVRIGTRDFASWFLGAVAKVAIYDYELTAAQLTAHYNVFPAPPQGAVNLTGAGQLASVAAPAATGAVPLAGAGTLTAPTRTPAATGAVTLAGAGVLAPAATLTAGGVATLSGAGGLGIVGAGGAGVVPLTGSGTLGVGVAALAVSAAVALTGAGALGLAPIVGAGGSAALSGSGALAYTGAPAFPATPVALAGSGVLSFPAVVAGARGGPALTGAGVLTVVAATPGAAPLSGAGVLAVAAAPSPSGAPALTGAGVLTLAWVPRPGGAVALAGAGALLVVAAAVAASRAVPLAGAGALGMAAVSVAASGSAGMSGSGVLVVVGVALGAVVHRPNLGITRRPDVGRTRHS